MKQRPTIAPRLDPDELMWVVKNVPEGIFLGYQAKWCADRSLCKIWGKSRRIGATWAEAGDCTLEAGESQGQDAFYIGYEEKMTQGFIRDCADFARAYSMVCSEIEEDEEVWYEGDERKSVHVYRLVFNSRHRIEALTSDPRNFRSRQGRAVLDEAAYMGQLGEMLKAAMAFLIWGGRVHIISSYKGTESEFYELDQDILAGKYPYGRHFTTFDDALADGLYKRICLIKRIEWSVVGEMAYREQIFQFYGENANEELLCIPSEGGGRYIPSIYVQQCMEAGIPVLTLVRAPDFALKTDSFRHANIQDWLEDDVAPLLEQLHPNLRSHFAQDFGMEGDLSYLMPCQVHPDLVAHIPFVLEMSGIPHREQEQILFFIVDRLPRFTSGALDARGNGSSLAQFAMQKYGESRIYCVKATQKWYLENFPGYRRSLQDRLFRLPLNEDLLQDHAEIIQIGGMPKVSDRHRKGTNGLQRHADGAIAGVLLWAAMQMPISPIDGYWLGQDRESLHGVNFTITGSGWGTVKADFDGNQEALWL